MTGCSVRKRNNHWLRYAIRRLSCRTLGLTNLKLSRRSTCPTSWPKIQRPAGLSPSIRVSFLLRLSKAFSNCPLQRQDKGDCFAKDKDRAVLSFFCLVPFFSEPSICARQCSLAFLLMKSNSCFARLCLKKKCFSHGIGNDFMLYSISW